MASISGKGPSVQLHGIDKLGVIFFSVSSALGSVKSSCNLFNLYKLEFLVILIIFKKMLYLLTSRAETLISICFI